MNISRNTIKLLKNKMHNWKNLKNSNKNINNNNSKNIQLKVLVIDIFNKIKKLKIKI